MSKKLSRSRRPRFESLEPKQLLAGDVLVSVVEGRLIVEGDELDNQIAITAGPEPGSYAVHGLDGTNVILQPPVADPAAAPAPAGEPMSTVVVHGVRAGVGIGMGDGDDRVVLGDVNFRGDVGIRMGAGIDQVIIGPAADPPPETAPLATAGDEMPTRPPAVNIGGSLRIGTGEGNDRVHVGQASIRGALVIETGSGDDSVVLGNPPSDPAVEPVAPAVAEDPADPATQRAAVRAGGVRVDLGAGNDTLVVDQVHTAGGLRADGGHGNDRLSVRASRIGRALSLLGGEGEGEDQVVVNHVSARHASIATGAGNDNVRIVDSLFHSLGVALGDGDDTLAVEGNKAQQAIFLGGEGQDTLLGLRNNRFRRAAVRGFELPAMSDGDVV